MAMCVCVCATDKRDSPSCVKIKSNAAASRVADQVLAAVNAARAQQQVP